LLPSHPTAGSFTAPPGWTGIDAHDTFGVASAQWTTTTASLQPGNTLTGFSFTTPDSPAIIGGTSAFFGFPVKQPYIYSIAPESGSVAAIVPTTVVPEPASVLMVLGAPALLL